MKKVNINLSVLLLSIFIAWSGIVAAQFTGKITYSIRYETDDTSMKGMMDILPSESYLFIKGQKLRFNQMIMGGGMQSFIVDKDQKVNTLLMNFMGQEYKVNMDEDQVALLEKAQELSLQETDKTEVIQGFNCKHVLATAKGDTLNIYYTEEIPTPAVLPQFASIKGLPLYYEVVKSGIKMTYKCTQVEKMEISDSEFQVPNSVKEIPFKEFAKNFAISK
jgi:GLPGLI family protein